MNLPTGRIDQVLNLVHKVCGIVLMVLAIAYVSKGYSKFNGTMQHLEDSADSTHSLIKEENNRQAELYLRLSKTLDSVDGTVRTSNATVGKLGSAIDTVAKDFTSTTGAVNGTLGGVQSTLFTVRTDFHGSMEKLNTSLDQMPPLFIQAKTSLASLNGLIVSMQPIAVNVAGITGDLKDMADDAKPKVHGALHPTKKAIAAGFIWHGLLFYLTGKRW